MKQITLYLNVYRAGYWHRQGKPNTTNIQAGDIYASEQAAKDAAEKDKNYIATVPFQLSIPEDAAIYVNSPDSVPTPMSVTRGNPLALLPWLVQTLPPICAAGDACAVSLEPAGDEGSVTYEEWRKNREQSGFQPAPSALYKPAHGGYPRPEHTRFMESNGKL